MWQSGMQSWIMTGLTGNLAQDQNVGTVGGYILSQCSEQALIGTFIHGSVAYSLLKLHLRVMAGMTSILACALGSGRSAGWRCSQSFNQSDAKCTRMPQKM